MSTRYNLANPRDHTNDLLHSPRNAPTQGASFRESTLDLDAYSNSNSSHGDAYNTQNTYNTRNNTTSSSQHQQPNTLTRTPTRTRTDTRNRSRSRTPSPPFDPKDPHAATWRQINRLGGLGSAVEKMIGNVPERRAKAERARVEALRKMEVRASLCVFRLRFHFHFHFIAIYVSTTSMFEARVAN